MRLSYPKHHLVKTGHISTCQVCNSKNLHTILDLGHQPLCSSLLTKEALNEAEINYPLRMVWCEDCTGVQIDYCVEANVVYFKDYTYRSGITKELVEYQVKISESLVKKYNYISELFLLLMITIFGFNMSIGFTNVSSSIKMIMSTQLRADNTSISILINDKR